MAIWRDSLNLKMVLQFINLFLTETLVFLILTSPDTERCPNFKQKTKQKKRKKKLTEVGLCFFGMLILMASIISNQFYMDLIPLLP